MNEHKIKTLVDQLNDFDYYYEMSDDSSKYSKGVDETKKIKQTLKGMTDQEIINVRKQLNVSSESLNRYFKEEFEGVNSKMIFENQIQWVGDETDLTGHVSFANKSYMLRVEQMDEKCWWACIYLYDDQVWDNNGDWQETENEAKSQVMKELNKIICKVTD